MLKLLVLLFVIKSCARNDIFKNAVLNLIKNQSDIDKIYLYATDPYEANSQYLTNRRKKVGLDQFNDPKAFMEYSNDMLNAYKNIEH